ncbi:hypothetical protein PG994_008535 [Apiospora phragmitis]|uniref:Uncharacterized protein n=1 Tax=Apiospora phragmitis TaxID=2905665 RepID=A0ABR1UHA5_9PEZI
MLSIFQKVVKTPEFVHLRYEPPISPETKGRIQCPNLDRIFAPHQACSSLYEALKPHVAQSSLVYTRFRIAARAVLTVLRLPTGDPESARAFLEGSDADLEKFKKYNIPAQEVTEWQKAFEKANIELPVFEVSLWIEEREGEKGFTIRSL